MLLYLQRNALEVFGHVESVKIVVILNPAGYMWTSSNSAFIHLRDILLNIPLK